MSKPPSRGPRIAALVASAFAAVLAITLLAGGGALLVRRRAEGRRRLPVDVA